MQWYDYLRFVTALLAVFAAYRLLRRVKEDHATYSTRLSEYVWIMFMVLFTQFEGALEAVKGDTPYRYGSILSLLIALAAVRATRKSTEPLQRWTKPTDYTACGHPIFLNDKLTGYCDKEVYQFEGLLQHIDHRPLHHVSLLFDDDDSVSQE